MASKEEKGNAFGFSRFVAGRYLWSQRSEAFVTIITVIAILGVAIGVGVLNTAMGIMTGFERELKSKIIGSTHVLVYRYGGLIADWERVVDTVSRVEGVSSASAYADQQVMITHRGKARGILIRGIIPESRMGKDLTRYLHGVDASLLEETPDDPLPAVVIGKELSARQGIIEGDAVSLLSPTVGSTPFGLMPRYKRFRVAAIYESGMAGYEERIAYIHLRAAQRFFKMNDSVTGLEVMVENVDESPQIAQKIVDALLDLDQIGFVAQDWTQANKELWEALKLEKTVYFIVLLLLIVMASFSIITTLVMIVLEKRKDIAILMTLGANSRSIANIFRWQGAVIGFIGVGSGTMLGLAACLGLERYGFPLPEKVFPVSTLPVDIEALNFVVVACSAFFICCLSTWYPSWRASKVQPGEVLRYE